MKILLISGRNFELYSENFFNNYDLYIIASKSQASKIPSHIKVFEVNEYYDEISKVYTFNEIEVRNIIKKIQPEKLVCSQEACLMLTAKMRQEFNIDGLKLFEMSIFRDKILMKEKLAQANLPTPYFTANINSSYNELKEKLQDGFIMKPVNSVGSRGVYRVFSQNDLDNILNEIDGCPYEAEQFIDGDFFHIDICIKNKQSLFCGVSKYSCPTIDLQKGKNLGSICLPSKGIFNKKCEEFAISCIKALGFYDGVYHMEVFYTNKTDKQNYNFIFLETAIRPVGLFGIVNYEFFGINLYDVDFKLQIGEDQILTNKKIDNESSVSIIPNVKPATNNKLVIKEKLNIYLYKSFMVFPKLNGKIKKLNIPKINSNYKIYWNVKEGEITKQTNTNTDFAGYIIFENATEEQLLKDFNYMKNDYYAISYE